MTKFLTVAVLCAVSLLMTGCGSIPFLTSANEKLLSGVDAYCGRSLDSRLIDLGVVNFALQGRAKVLTWCFGDPPASVGGDTAAKSRSIRAAPEDGTPWRAP